jgi:glycosyltransferase involved in cell wall biosynthesis
LTFQPLISIVVPHFNRSALLAETLDSIRAQAYENWEVLVVDDGSADVEWSAVQRLCGGNVRVIRRTDGQKGPSRCRNLGAAEAKGEYLVFVDSDDLLAPWCLDERMVMVQSETGADFWVFPVLLFERRPGDSVICWNQFAGDDDLERFLKSDPPWHTSSPVWSKEAFLSLGGFNERVMYGDDAELHARALLRALRIQKFPGCLPDLFIRRGPEQRITSGWSSALIESRRIRLEEGTRLLTRTNGAKNLSRLWEGQYFVEGEELLFNVENSREAIGMVLDAWVTGYQPGIFRRWLVKTYFNACTRCRKNAYWLVRLARRLAMLTLPSQFFPSGGRFQKWRLSETDVDRVRARLGRGVEGMGEPSP